MVVPDESFMNIARLSVDRAHRRRDRSLLRAVHSLRSLNLGEIWLSFIWRVLIVAQHLILHDTNELGLEVWWNLALREYRRDGCRVRAAQNVSERLDLRPQRYI